MTPALAIVIIGRNEGERLTRCMHSVNRSWSVEGNAELIYVDSCSTDGSPEAAGNFTEAALRDPDNVPSYPDGPRTGTRATRGRPTPWTPG